MPNPIKVLICDDSAVIRAALKDLLSGEPDIEVVGQAAANCTGVRITSADAVGSTSTSLARRWAFRVVSP